MGVRLLLPFVLMLVVVSVNTAPSVLFAQSGEPNTQDIVITNGSASPSVVQVPVGASIRWINSDSKAHELVLEFDDGFVLPLLNLEPGTDFTMAFTDSEALLFRSLNDAAVTGSITISTATPLNTPAPTTGAPIPSATAVSTSPAIAATATPRPATATPTPRVATATPPPPTSTPTNPVSTAVANTTSEPVVATTATATPTTQVAATTPIPTPPPPAAGGLGLVAEGGPGGVLWLGILGAAVMTFAISALLYSGSKNRITFERRR